MNKLAKIRSVKTASLAQTSGNVAVIKVPVYVKQHEQKMKELEVKRRFEVMRKVFYRGDTSKAVISCNKKEYNFYFGQIYNKHFPIPLMSRYWLKKKSAGQKFTISTWDSNPSLPMKLDPIPVETELSPAESMSHYYSQFEQFGLSEEILGSIKAMGLKYPTPMQALIIPKIMKQDNMVCVGETGSGKTLAYLIPIMQKLQKIKDNYERPSETPLSLVVVPGRELAEQIAVVAHTLGSSCGIKVKLLIPEGTKNEDLIPYNGDHVDLLVSTIGIIKKLSSKGVFNLMCLKHLVFDEADTLFDDSFQKYVSPFLMRIVTQDSLLQCGSERNGAQIILVSATEPTSIVNVFQDWEFHPAFEYAVSPHAHRVMPHVTQKFIRVDNGTRSGILLELAKKDFNKKSPVMIFCNKSPTCDWLSLFLKENDVPNVRFHAGLNFMEREEALEKFLNGEVDVFCCTDLASRGIDTQKVKHVINFDFPNNVSDYILRAGRTGRVGTNHGHVTNLVVQTSSVFVVQDIENSIRNSKKIENVDANIAGKISELYDSYWR